MSMALVAYRLLTLALEPFAPLLLNRRAARGKEDPQRLRERLGYATAVRPDRPVVWLHGASVGESLSLLPLIEALARERPDLTLLVTSGTVTSAAVLARRLPPGAIHQYVAIDCPGAARRFLAHWRPGLAVFVESELWPNLLLDAKASGCRLALLGARLSQDSAKGWARGPAAARALFGAFDLILAQDAVSRARLQALGAVVADDLDLKQAAAPLPHDEAALADLKTQVGDRPVLVAASTHPGEDERIVDAFKTLPQPRPLLVIAPRHPARAGALADDLRAQGLSLARRSTGERLLADTEVYLADTLGELGLFFRLAQVVVMGGSLTGGIGGHNPLEPARLGLPVITGPDVANFRGTYDALLAFHAAVMTPHQGALAVALADLTGDPVRAREMGLRAKAYAERSADIVKAALMALDPLLPRPAP